MSRQQAGGLRNPLVTIAARQLHVSAPQPDAAAQRCGFQTQNNWRRVHLSSNCAQSMFASSPGELNNNRRDARKAVCHLVRQARQVIELAVDTDGGDDRIRPTLAQTLRQARRMAQQVRHRNRMTHRRLINRKRAGPLLDHVFNQPRRQFDSGCCRQRLRVGAQANGSPDQSRKQSNARASRLRPRQRSQSNVWRQRLNDHPNIAEPSGRQAPCFKR